MKTNKLFLLAASALLFANCAHKEIDVPFNTGVAVAVMEAEDTKSNTTDQGYFTWTAGDAIWINTENGDLKGTLSEGVGSSSGTFSYSYGEGQVPTGYAMYPYSAGHKINAGVITFNMPASYDLGATVSNTNAPMLAVPAARNNESTVNFNFSHLGGVIRVIFKNAPVGTDRFTLSLGDAKINGEFEVANGIISSAETETPEETVTTLNFTALTSVQDITLFVPVPVGNYTGIEAKLYKGTEELGTWGSTTAVNNVERKSLILMSPITFSTAGGNIENVKVWDGATLVKPADKDAAASRVLFEVYHAEELAWVLRNWNGGSTSASRPTTIKLMNNIDFGGHEIYFDMQNTSVSFHSVTLDGNNHTIKNYKVEGVIVDKAYKAGLFPQTSGVTIKDLTIDGAVVGNENPIGDLYSGALIGIATDQKPTPYTTVITNVIVQNSTIKGVNKVGGLVGQANGIHVVSDVEVKNTTLTGYGADAGSLGGVYGYLKVEGESSFVNSTVTGGAIICENGEDVASRGSSGFIGTLHMGMSNSSLTLTNCDVEGIDLSKSNTQSPLNKYVGTVRTGTAATLTIDGAITEY